MTKPLLCNGKLGWRDVCKKCNDRHTYVLTAAGFGYIGWGRGVFRDFFLCLVVYDECNVETLVKMTKKWRAFAFWYR